eukprot:1270361-Alexandrium_andersonii.AAC.1
MQTRTCMGADLRRLALASAANIRRSAPTCEREHAHTSTSTQRSRRGARAVLHGFAHRVTHQRA